MQEGIEKTCWNEEQECNYGERKEVCKEAGRLPEDSKALERQQEGNNKEAGKQLEERLGIRKGRWQEGSKRATEKKHSKRKRAT